MVFQVVLWVAVLVVVDLVAVVRHWWCPLFSPTDGFVVVSRCWFAFCGVLGGFVGGGVSGGGSHGGGGLRWCDTVFWQYNCRLVSDAPLVVCCLSFSGCLSLQLLCVFVALRQFFASLYVVHA